MDYILVNKTRIQSIQECRLQVRERVQMSQNTGEYLLIKKEIMSLGKGTAVLFPKMDNLSLVMRKHQM